MHTQVCFVMPGDVGSFINTIPVMQYTLHMILKTGTPRVHFAHPDYCN